MIIVIEGCDGTGKSTLAAKIQKNILTHEFTNSTGRGVNMLHAGPLEGDALEAYEIPLRDYKPDGDHVIIDRWHWGETVYGPLYRKSSKLTSAGFYHVDKYLDSKGAVMLLATQTPEVIRERLASRGEDFLKDEHIEQVLAGFEHAFTTSVMTERHKVTDAEDSDVAAACILGYIREKYATELEMFPTYVGPRYPAFLLLGEKRKDPSWPSAFVPKNATSGKYLLDSLSRAVLRDSGLANACEEDVPALYNALNAPVVCTLGKEAGKVVEASGVPHFEVPHPQYIRRFHNSKQREYGQVIARGLFGEEVTDWLSSESQT